MSELVLDWATMILISYVFLLVLLLVLVFIHGQRTIRSKYSKQLDEKEQKVMRMQIDLEETLEATDAYAGQMRADWSAQKKQTDEAHLRLQKRLLELDAAIMSLTGRVGALEVQLRTIKAHGGLAPAIIATEPDTATGQALFAPPAAQAVPPLPEPEPEPPASPAPDDLPQRAAALLAAGLSIAETAQALEISTTEMTLLYNRIHSQ